MNSIFEFSNREVALIFWAVATFIILAIWDARKTGSKPVTRVIKLLFVKRFRILYLMAFGFLFSLHGFAWWMDWWRLGDLKDSIVWGFTAAPILLFRSINPPQRFFAELFWDGLRISVILEFILNFYSFSLVTELLLVPVLALLAGLSAYALLSEKELERRIGKGLELVYNGLLVTAGLYSFALVVADFGSIATEANVRSMLIPYVLTLLYIPFLYFLALYASYEQLYLKVKYMAVDHPKSKKVRRAILKSCHLILPRVRRVHKLINKEIFYRNIDLSEYFSEITKVDKA